MNHALNRKTTTALASLALAALLTACGGVVESEARAQALAQALPSASASASASASVAIVAPLLDDEGRVLLSDSTAVPTDPGARTRSGRYATATQAAELEAALGNRAIPITVDPGADAAGAVEVATGLVAGMQAANDLRADAPVLVRGSDMRLAATLANRLEEDGFSHVFLVSR